jgi:translocation and assembly module TamB
VATLPVARSGMDLATLDLDVNATGGYRPGALDATLRIEHGTVRLPKKTPRELQRIERRADIVVGRRPEKKREPLQAAAAGVPAEGAKPFVLTLRVLVPNRLSVVQDNPRIRIDLKADVSLELQGGSAFASGSVDVQRGTVEPLGGRVFHVQRGKVTFTGGPPQAALLDVEATYDNPAAKVTVNVAGPLTHPEIRFSSQPAMDEGQIALLIATGRTELKAGTGSTLTCEEAGRAALGAVATQVFRDVVQDKLPVSNVSLDSGSFRAGNYYFQDKVYVSYVRRFEARPDLHENQNEVQVEYQMSRRWSLEGRYGDALSGGASLVWSKDY